MASLSATSPPSDKKHVAVIGAGVIGLSTAVRILTETSRPVSVTVIADRFSPHTTSDGSGGFWEPYALGKTPESSIRKWSKETWDYFHQLSSSADAKDVGAQFVSGYTLHDSGEPKDPMFKDIVLGYRRVTAREIQEQFPFAKWGFFSTVLQVSVKAYLPRLMQKFKDRGGKVEFGTVKNLADLADRFDIIINCTGPGAIKLMKDVHMEHIRGQVHRVRAPWIKHFYIVECGDGQLTYVLPLGDLVVVGGVAQPGNSNEKVDDHDSQAIWNRAVRFLPQLQKAQKVEEWAGLRPGRTQVRLEAETIHTPNKNVLVIHNYGHGGAGVTLHWGCAGDVVKMLNHSLERMSSTGTKSSVPTSKL